MRRCHTEFLEGTMQVLHSPCPSARPKWLQSVLGSFLKMQMLQCHICCRGLGGPRGPQVVLMISFLGHRHSHSCKGLESAGYGEPKTANMIHP